MYLDLRIEPPPVTPYAVKVCLAGCVRRGGGREHCAAFMLSLHVWSNYVTYDGLDFVMGKNLRISHLSSPLEKEFNSCVKVWYIHTR
jgi:hypothetical protein